MCVFALSEEAENEWVGTTKEYRWSIEHLVPIIISKTASPYKITLIIEHKIKIGTEKDKLRAG